MIERDGRHMERGGSSARRSGQPPAHALRLPVRGTQTGAGGQPRPPAGARTGGTHTGGQPGAHMHSTHSGDKPSGGRGPSVGHRRSPLRRDRKGSRQVRRPSMPFSPHRKEEQVIPPLAPGNVRIIPLGGVEEIGKNMTVVEYKDTIIVVDAGIQFKEESTPGIDFILPNTKYLEERKHKVKAIVITHGHLDHIGAIPYIMDKIGNPTIYTASLTKEIIAKRNEEFPKSPKLDFEIVKGGETREISKNFSVRFFSVTHNIPEGIGMILETPIGNIAYPGEFKFDYDKDGKPIDIDLWAKIGEQRIQIGRA